MQEVGFSGVRSGVASEEKTTLRIMWETAWIDVEAHLITSIPKGIDIILGLDNNLSSVGLRLRLEDIR